MNSSTELQLCLSIGFVDVLVNKARGTDSFVI